MDNLWQWLEHWVTQWPALSIALGTLVSEDLSYLAALAGISSGKIPWVAGFFGYTLGVLIGDLGLFGLGRLSKILHFPRLQKWAQKLSRTVESHHQLTDQVLLLSRFVPGTRIPTYVSLGLAGYSIWRFSFILTLAAMTYMAVGVLVVSQLEFSANASGALMAALLAFVMSWWIFRSISFFIQHREHLVTELRGLFWHWRRWTRLEFWPPSLFYAPIVVYFIGLMVRHRGWSYILHANPGLPNSGLVGESKSNLEELLTKADPRYSLRFQFLSHSMSLEEKKAKVEKFLETHGLQYPVVLKPIYGQRGSGVVMAGELAEVENYLEQYQEDILVQEYCEYPKEIGVFYVRQDDESKGKIFSVTEKIFPTVTGDGRSSLAELVLANPLTRWNYRLFAHRFSQRWHEVISHGDEVILVRKGNHAQGAVFRDGTHLITPELESWLDKVSREIPGFYMGRYDLRYQRPEDLSSIENLRIIELNGAGAESTDVYDSRLSPYAIYRRLFRQWSFVFAIGRKNFFRSQTPNYRCDFLRDVWRCWRMTKKYPATYQ